MPRAPAAAAAAVGAGAAVAADEVTVPGQHGQYFDGLFATLSVLGGQGVHISSL
jgi:hypothetical protein